MGRCLTAKAKLIRIMPNTPCLVGAGMVVIAPGKDIDDDEVTAVKKLLEPVGRVIVLAEKQLDAVTGLSGSGPAYVFAFIEALADGGVKAGLNKETALLLSAQTVLGAAQMMLKTGEHPSVLKDRVTSPGGTTIEGLSVLEKGCFRGNILAAVEAAARRSRELAGVGDAAGKKEARTG
ncbi:MAG TPA: pyrroline-5-carboxylate reductase, partial [Firmicutes bacterium]|nr:pyrroline-5-carboxylate reductase [Bacillota bacterium]